MRLPDKTHHRRGDQPLHNADGQVNGLHEEEKRGKGQLRQAGKPGLQHDPEGPQLQGQNGGDHGSQQDAARGRLAAHNLLINERVSNETGKEPHIE